MTGASLSSEAAPTSVDVVVTRIRAVYRRWSRTTPIEQMRQDWDAMFDAAPNNVPLAPVSAGGVAAGWAVAPEARDDQAVIYFHGGGFKIGSSRSHHQLMAGISGAAGCRVLGVDYRLAPEHPFPAALQDACVAYEWMLTQGYNPKNLAFAGDSAGAGLAISALLALREANRPLPAAAVLMSAWTDLTASGPSYETRAAADPIHQRPMILATARDYLGPYGDPRNPLVSSLFADLRGLPPLLIQVGDRETVLSDSTLFAEKARAAGVYVALEVWDGMIHVFQQFPAELVEAREALRSVGDFLKARFGSQPASRVSKHDRHRRIWGVRPAPEVEPRSGG